MNLVGPPGVQKIQSLSESGFLRFMTCIRELAVCLVESGQRIQEKDWAAISSPSRSHHQKIPYVGPGTMFGTWANSASLSRCCAVADFAVNVRTRKQPPGQRWRRAKVTVQDYICSIARKAARESNRSNYPKEGERPAFNGPEVWEGP